MRRSSNALASFRPTTVSNSATGGDGLETGVPAALIAQEGAVSETVARQAGGHGVVCLVRERRNP